MAEKKPILPAMKADVCRYKLENPKASFRTTAAYFSKLWHRHVGHSTIQRIFTKQDTWLLSDRAMDETNDDDKDNKPNIIDIDSVPVDVKEWDDTLLKDASEEWKLSPREEAILGLEKAITYLECYHTSLPHDIKVLKEILCFLESTDEALGDGDVHKSGAEDLVGRSVTVQQYDHDYVNTGDNLACVNNERPLEILPDNISADFVVEGPNRKETSDSVEIMYFVTPTSVNSQVPLPCIPLVVSPIVDSQIEHVEEDQTVSTDTLETIEIDVKYDIHSDDSEHAEDAMKMEEEDTMDTGKIAKKRELKKGTCKRPKKSTPKKGCVSGEECDVQKPTKKKKVPTAYIPEPCPYCGKMIKGRRREFEIHLLKHTGEKPLQCSLCGKCFRQPGAFRIHLMLHKGDLPFKCEMCDKQFVTPSQLKRHVANAHIKDNVDKDESRPHKCPECNATFFWNHSLKRHMKLHADVKTFVCEVCSKSFSYSWNLKEHMRMHTKSKPYECKLCGELFGYANMLKQHVRRHTGDRPYQCSLCEKSYISSQQLHVHFRTHTKETPYPCDLCDRAFSWKQSLNKHKLSHARQGKTAVSNNFIQPILPKLGQNIPF